MSVARIARPSGVLLLIALAASTGAGCGGKGTGKVEYSVSAEQNYEAGQKQLEAEDWIAAAKYFAFVKARFPYSRFAILSELRLADAEYGAEHYLAAIDAYKMFIKFHPTHEMVTNGYAAYRIGASYYQMLPGDWFLLPPSYEKDQSSTEDAYRELTSFLTKYKQSPYEPQAKKLLLACSRKLAQHEWYVANFYWKKDRPMGTVLRLRTLLDKYPGAGYDAEALWLLGRAYVKVNMADRAKKTWQKLIDEHPRHRRAGDARDALAHLASAG